MFRRFKQYLYIVYTMPFFRRRYIRRRGQRKMRSTRRGRRVGKVSTVVKRYVKKAIHRQVENKEKIDYWSNNTIQTIGSSNGNTGGGCRALILSPTQGTGDSERVGNQIKIVKGTLSFHVNLKAYDAVFNPYNAPCVVKIWLFRKIGVNFTEAITTTTAFFDDFFKINNTTTYPQGNVLDPHFPINVDNYRVLATKTIELGLTYASATGEMSSGATFDNSKMSYRGYFNWGKYARKVLKYQDNNGTCTNDNLYIFIQPVLANGTSSGGYKLCEWHGVNRMVYEDA